MFRTTVRSVICFVAFLAASPSAYAQINWNITYSDNGGTIAPGAFGFSDGTVVGSTTLGQLRRDSVTAATTYWSSILDGRGTIPINLNASLNIAPGEGGVTLASFGASGGSGFTDSGYFMGHPMYERARSNASFTSGVAGSGQANFNSGVGWHYAVPGTNTTLNSGTVDLVSVLIHEIGHGLGMTSGVTDNTTGRGGNPLTPFTVGTSPDWYNSYDYYLQRGNGPFATSALFRTDVTQSNYGTFAGPASTFTGGNENPTGSNPTNNTTTGLYFGGPYTREIFGGPVPLFSPATFISGSSLSHDNTSPAGLMNWEIDTNTTRRLQPYEIGMLLDMGWNVYHWNNTTAHWKDGVTTTVTPDDTLTLANSKWLTDKGIVLGATGTEYNTFLSQSKAPILPPSGQITSNIVLNFGGSGSSSYTSTNDIGTMRLARLNLNSTSSATNTITGGTLNFGLNSDGSASVLVPKIVQQGSGAFIVGSNLQTNNVATQVLTGNVTFPGSAGMTVDGTGTGQVTLSGIISGNGSFTKAGTFTTIMSGNNSYTGGTTVNAGILLVNGQTGTNSGTGTGNVTVSGGTFGGTGRAAGTVSVSSGGNLAPGSGGTGALTVGNGLTFATGASYTVQLNGSAPANYTHTNVTGGSISLGNATLLSSLGYTPGSSDKLFIMVNDPGVTVTGTFNSLAQGASFTIGSTTAYISYDGDSIGSTSTGGNDVVIAFSPIPVPEPGAILGIAFAALLIGGAIRNWRNATEAQLAV